MAFISSEDSEYDNIAEFLLRNHIVKLRSDGHGFFVNEKGVEEKKEELGWLWRKLKGHTDVPALSLRINYDDPYMAHPHELLEEITDSPKLLKPVLSLEKYLERTVSELNEHVARGYKAKTLTFEQAQRTGFIKRETLAHEYVRVVGVSEEIETLLLTKLNEVLQKYNSKPLNIFYYGSRVMPRSEVVKRDPELKKKIPIHDDGVVKNSVRIKGMTKISDLELIALIYFEKELSFEDQRVIAQEFQHAFEQSFRLFPVHLKIIAMNTEQSPKKPFDTIKSFFIKNRGQTLSPFQFVEIKARL